MKELECVMCGVKIGDILNDEDILDNTQEPRCLCPKCLEKAKDTDCDFTIISKPSYIKLVCPFCGEYIEIDWKLVPNNTASFSNIYGEQVECPCCKNDITLGDWDYD